MGALVANRPSHRPGKWLSEMLKSQRRGGQALWMDQEEPRLIEAACRPWRRRSGQ